MVICKQMSALSANFTEVGSGGGDGELAHW
jgi:hypothetical protein